MAIIAFWSDEEKETGQTMSLVALSTYMSIKHNYRILNVDTSFRDQTLENSYWDLSKEEKLVKTIVQDKNQLGLESGVEGLLKMIRSNRIESRIVPNYTRIVFKEKLDILCPPKTNKYDEYKEIAEKYTTILQVADRSYDMVFVDVSKMLPKSQVKQILEIADIIVVNVSQRMKIIDEFLKLRMENEFFRKNNIMINIGRYDNYSKYNIKNLSRYMGEKKDIYAIPYNTLFFEACSDSNVSELFFRFMDILETNPEDRNALFIKEIDRFTKDLLYKMQELQLKA